MKWGVLLGLDVLMTPLALLAALSLNQPETGVLASPLISMPALILLMGISALLGVLTDTYRIQLKAYEIHAISLSMLQAGLLSLSLLLLDRFADYGTPGEVIILFGMTYIMGVVGLRFVMLQMLLTIIRRGSKQVRVLIYGAGSTGRGLAAALRMDEAIHPVAFVDNSRVLQGNIVQGLRVYGPNEIGRVARKRQIDRILIAMPDMSRPKMVQLSRRLEDLGLEVRALPSFAELTRKGSLIEQLEPVAPIHFLGRESLDATLPDGVDTYGGRCILISGAGGSIGSELCRQLLPSQPAKLVLYENSEVALYTIEMELRALTEGTDIQIKAVLGSVTDNVRVARVLQDEGVEVVLHAAAYKHVPMVEANALAGVQNNVIGTQTLAEAAGAAGVERFILISTDKAVRPSNIMGASKRMAEIVVQDLARRTAQPGGPETIYSTVRFGNVIGSSGSVIPLFEEQIGRGGPLTLTHRDVTRYFMTIPEATRLVLLAGSFGEGGDVFVLDMGEPVPIYDLARQMIEAAGYEVRDASNPDGDIEIITTGLRPGEKLHEELMIGEGVCSTVHPKILEARERQLSELEVAAALKAIRSALDTMDEVALRMALQRWTVMRGSPDTAQIISADRDAATPR